MGDWLASAHSYEVWAKAAGLWSDEPAPGAVLVMKYVDRPGAGYSGHVGMVLWVGDDGAVVSVDGNVTDKVAVRHRRPDQIRGYVYWWKHPVVTARFPLPLEPAEWVTLETTPMDEVDMPLIDNGTKARLAAIKARLGGELVEAREEIKAARQDKRDTESGSPERVAARAALAALRADRKETKADLRDVAQAIREFEREHGLRPAAVDDWIAEKIGLVIHRILNAVGQQLEGLEGRVMEALPGLVAKAAASVVTQVDFSQIVPGAAGRALESVDEQVVATLLDVFEAWNDDDGLTMDDVETIARKRLAEAGIELTVAALHKRAMALLGS